MSWVAERMQTIQRETRKRRVSAWMPRAETESPAAGQVLLRSPALTLVLDSRAGGVLRELSDKKSGRVLLHSGWVERLLDPRARVRDFARGLARELPALPPGPCSARVEEGKGFVRSVLSRRTPALQAAKTVTLPHRGRRALFAHRLTNVSGRPAEFLFGTGLTLNLKDAHVNRTGEAAGVRRFSVLDPAARLEVRWQFSRPARLWYFPLETGSGARRVYRGVELTWLWPVKLQPGESWQVRWQWEVEEPGGWHLR